MSLRQTSLFCLLSAIWGGSYVLIKFALKGFSPLAVVSGRLWVAAVVLGIFILVQRQGKDHFRSIVVDVKTRPGAAIVASALAVGLPFVLITVGELVVPSGLTAVLIAPMPIFVALFAPFIDDSERASPATYLSLVVGLLGIALAAGAESVQSAESFLGVFAMLIAAASYALGGFVIKHRYQAMAPAASSFLTIALPAIVILPFGISDVITGQPTAESILAILGLGAISTAVAFVLYYRLIFEIGAGRSALISYVTPAFALIYGATLLGEEITITAVVGLLLIFAGTITASRHQSRRQETPQADLNSQEASQLADSHLKTRSERSKTFVGSGLDRSDGLIRPTGSRRFVRSSDKNTKSNPDYVFTGQNASDTGGQGSSDDSD